MVAEISAGTGIFTGQLVAAGPSPIAIEPVPEMREILRAQLPDADVRDGHAERFPRRPRPSTPWWRLKLSTDSAPEKP